MHPNIANLHLQNSNFIYKIGQMLKRKLKNVWKSHFFWKSLKNSHWFLNIQNYPKFSQKSLKMPKIYPKSLYFPFPKKVASLFSQKIPNCVTSKPTKTHECKYSLQSQTQCSCSNIIGSRRGLPIILLIFYYLYDSFSF